MVVLALVRDISIHWPAWIELSFSAISGHQNRIKTYLASGKQTKFYVCGQGASQLYNCLQTECNLKIYSGACSRGIAASGSISLIFLKRWNRGWAIFGPVPSVHYRDLTLLTHFVPHPASVGRQVNIKCSICPRANNTFYLSDVFLSSDSATQSCLCLPAESN